MLRSSACNLYKMGPERLAEIGECIYDQGGYFIINGGEKAIIAQERQTTNKVYVFERRQPSKFSWTAEIRSNPEGSNIPAQTLKLGMFARPSKTQKQTKYCIWAYLPQLGDGVPICVLFRALGCVDDRLILERICYVGHVPIFQSELRRRGDDGAVPTESGGVCGDPHAGRGGFLVV